MRTLLLAGILALGLGGTASADPGAPPPASTDVQSIGGLWVRTETTTVVQDGVQVRVVRVFNNDVLVREVRTPLGLVAGFEAAPRASIIVIEERVEPAPAAAPSQAGLSAAAVRAKAVPAVAIAQLPSTSTAP